MTNIDTNTSQSILRVMCEIIFIIIPNYIVANFNIVIRKSPRKCNYKNKVSYYKREDIKRDASESSN